MPPLRTLAVVSVCGLLVSPAQAQSPVDKATLAWTLPWDADWVTSVSFVGPNRLAAGNNLGDILVWDLPPATLPAPPAVKGKESKPVPIPVRRLAGHTNTVNRLLTTPDQRWLISASNDHTLAYWDMQAEPADAGAIVVNARARAEAEARKKTGAKVPDALEAKVKMQKPRQVLTGHKDWVLGLSMTGDGNTLVSGDDKGEIIVWDRPAGKELRRWKLKGWAWAVAVEPAAKSVLVSERVPLIFDSGAMSALKLWDPKTGEMKADLSKEIKERISVAAFSADGKWLAIGQGGETDMGKITLLDPVSGKKLKVLPGGHKEGVTDLVFHPDGKHLLSAGRDTNVKIWRLDEGKLVKELGQPRGGQFKDWYHAVAVSPDGRWIAAADMAGQVQVWTVP